MTNRATPEAWEPAKLRLLMDSIVDYAIFTLTNGGVIDSWNSGAERMFGYRAADIVGQHFAMLFTPEDRLAGVAEQELADARTYGRASDDRWHQRQDGSRFFCSGVTTRIAGNLGFAKIARDLTEKLAREDVHSQLANRVDARPGELREEVLRGVAARAQIRELLERVVTAQEEERSRIARDLHDQLGQQLTGLRLVLDQHREHCGDTETIERALQLAQTIDTEVDFLAWQLRPAVLDNLGLATALPRYLREWSKYHDIPSQFQGSGPATGVLSPATETTFYRIAQEALTNVVKHARASRVDMILEQRDQTVVLVIEDDGVGFNTVARDTTESGVGLAGMRERAALVGATLLIESTPGKGTTVFLRCPVTFGMVTLPAVGAVK